MASNEILEALPLPALIVGRNHRVQGLNDAAISLIGADLVGRHYATAFRQPALSEQIERVLSGSSAKQVRYLTTLAGQERTFNVHVAPLVSTSEALLTFQDVSSHEEAGQMRSDFVANVSHELRTPLTALTGFIETLRGPARDDPDARDRFLDIMEKEGRRMNRLVTDLLSLSRVEDMARVRPRTLMEIDAVLLMVRNALGRMAEERDVHIIINIGVECPVEILGDQDQLTQVFTNLIENAIKYGKQGGTVTVDLSEAEHVAAFKGKGLRIAVTDEGEGIAAHHIGRLTERFYRVDSHRSRELGGTGLGLAIVKHIVNRHRGRLRIESTPGEGSVFTVTLPFEDQPLR